MNDLEDSEDSEDSEDYILPESIKINNLKFTIGIPHI